MSPDPLLNLLDLPGAALACVIAHLDLVTMDALACTCRFLSAEVGACRPVLTPERACLALEALAQAASPVAACCYLADVYVKTGWDFYDFVPVLNHAVQRFGGRVRMGFDMWGVGLPWRDGLVVNFSAVRPMASSRLAGVSIADAFHVVAALSIYTSCRRDGPEAGGSARYTVRLSATRHPCFVRGAADLRAAFPACARRPVGLVLTLRYGATASDVESVRRQLRAVGFKIDDAHQCIF